MQDKKEIIITDLREEIERIKNHYQVKLNEAISEITNLEKLLQESQDVLSNVKSDLQAEKAKTEVRTAEKAELEKEMAEMTEILKEKDSTIASYLQQIAKLQQLLEDTEKEIEDVEAYHLAIENQLKEEIKRTEERFGQVSEDLTRESSSTHAQDILIRTVLQESELGKVSMFIVDYFENPKRKVLAMETIGRELNFTAVRTRSHLRLLHGLGVINFNEVSGEIKQVRQ